MSVEQTKVVDFIGIENASGDVVLTISDHLGWSGDEQEGHIELLQEKINAYLSFIESGQILEDYPRAGDRRRVISVVGKYPPEGEGIRFFDAVRERLAEAGYGFRVERLPDF